MCEEMLGRDKEERRWKVEVEVKEQRKRFYKQRGVSLEWVRRCREEGREVRGELEGRDVEVQQQERFERI